MTSADWRMTMWMRNCWQVVAFSSEIVDAPLACTVCGEPIVLFRTPAGDAVALADRCPHRFVPLSLGRVVGDQIQCGYHGLCFDAEGTCVRVPGQDTVPSRARVRKYPLVERYAFAWIWLGDVTLADPATIPDFHWVDDPAWAAVNGYHHFGANYQLVNDNLLDLSHESFVHKETIGNESVAEAPCMSPCTVTWCARIATCSTSRHRRSTGAQQVSRDGLIVGIPITSLRRDSISLRMAQCRRAPTTKARRSSARC